MPGQKSNTHRRNVQPAFSKGDVLTTPELKIVAERLAVALDIDSNSIGLALVILDHLDGQRLDPVMLSSSISTIKDYLFVNTTEAGDAQRALQAEIRAKVLPFTRRKGAA